MKIFHSTVRSSSSSSRKAISTNHIRPEAYERRGKLSAFSYQFCSLLLMGHIFCIENSTTRGQDGDTSYNIFSFLFFFFFFLRYKYTSLQNHKKKGIFGVNLADMNPLSRPLILLIPWAASAGTNRQLRSLSQPQLKPFRLFNIFPPHCVNYSSRVAFLIFNHLIRVCLWDVAGNLRKWSAEVRLSVTTSWQESSTGGLNWVSMAECKVYPDIDAS